MVRACSGVPYTRRDENAIRKWGLTAASNFPKLPTYLYLRQVCQGREAGEVIIGLYNGHRGVNMGDICHLGLIHISTDCKESYQDLWNYKYITNNMTIPSRWISVFVKVDFVITVGDQRYVEQIAEVRPALWWRHLGTDSGETTADILVHIV